MNTLINSLTVLIGIGMICYTFLELIRVKYQSIPTNINDDELKDLKDKVSALSLRLGLGAARDDQR